MYFSTQKVYFSIKGLTSFFKCAKIKKNNIIDYFKEDIQIFITTTDIKDINDELKAKSDIYVVDNGNFNKEE